ncbi:hypothetical protein [Actinomadura decatromicini]|uniref:DUF4190 domain-containing protein n=1 Tax=Actinomadura decatromicini TaxID=2604572 RepID=A0A5D3FNU8_9ACTN|nr:hypothetical protein [Actinomadura decatromicini]TYK49692.1 hypothetical protein FXF68_18445 [Actinomadura decatromicini]
MSGYGGQPPSGEGDPYGGAYGAQQPPGAGDPYGTYGGQPPAGAYGAQQPPGVTPYGTYGPPGVPSKRVSSGTITAALVCNCVAIVLCCNFVAIAGVVTALNAQRRADTDPRSARNLTIWSWSLFAVSTVLGLIIGIVYLIALDSGSG